MSTCIRLCCESRKRLVAGLFSASGLGVSLAACGSVAETEPNSSLEASAPQHYVALGDSYAAMGSRAATDPDDPCAVAEDSYPVLLADALGVEDFVHASCQGAVTSDVGEKTALGTAASEGTPQVAALGGRRLAW